MTKDEEGRSGSPIQAEPPAWDYDGSANVDGLSNHLGMMIERLRLERGMSQLELALAIQALPTEIEAYESGRERIPPVRLLEVATLLQVPLSAFFQDLDER